MDQLPLVCARCQELEAERLALIQENTQLGGELAGLQHTLRRQGAEVVGLRNELRKVREEDPASADVRAILNAWKRLTGHPKAKTPLDGKRANIVRKALRSHSGDELMLALEGLALKPYVGDKGRTVVGTAARRFDDIEYALGDETRIQKCVAVAVAARQAAGDRREAMWRLWAQLAAQENVVMGILSRSHNGVVDAEVAP